MALIFNVIDADHGMFDYDDREAGDDIELCGRLAEQHDGGRSNGKAYQAALAAVIARAPDRLEAHVYNASFWDGQGKPKKALDAAQAGISIANRRIPEGFLGRIEWGHFENRAYLRLLHFAVQSLSRLRRHKEAFALIERMLELNPQDNQGMRFQLGSEAFRAGLDALAIEIFERDAPDYPPYWYELALCHFKQSRYAEAATAMRRGFAANPYIGEILSGTELPLTLPCWHASDLEEPESALDYMAYYGRRWREGIERILFGRWLFNHPKVLAERAAVMEARDALAVAKDRDKRKALMAQLDAALDSINGNISAQLVALREDHYSGETTKPWLVGYRLPPGA